MLRNGRLRKVDFGHNIVADAGVNRKQIFDNGNSRRMRQGFQQSGNFVLLVGEILCFGNAHFNILILQYYDIKLKQKNYLRKNKKVAQMNNFFLL